MYINFWYPICASEDCNDEKPFRTRVLGLRFVAFRDAEGQARVMRDVCIHRGGSLGKGWVRDGQVVCPYHGWRFGGDGKCTHIPTLPDDSPPARAKVDSYPTEERYGIVFAFLGDLPEEERPPLLEIPEWDQPGWRANKLTVFEVGAFYERSMENGLDPSHNEFVHPAQGSPNINANLRRRPLDVQDIPWGSKFLVTFENEVKGTEALGEEATLVPEVEAGSGHVGPNTMITWINFSETNRFSQYFFEAPIDENRTRVFFVNMRAFMLEPENDERIAKVNMIVAQEDIQILEELDPVRTPKSTAKEVLVPSDGAVMRYRKWLREWDEKGWRIDSRRLRADAGDIAYSIPCPDRRSSGNWVLDPVPLQPAGD
ncbi:MAG: aromatic ring-hydroxylating dioxygenase subunit alpha [Gammaproteobacteria bacterium]|nr:MAG: aromatic ring-hydroxylating dioxygenase subunit alpha [Gammaproteobacteria bacterium]